MDNEKKELRSKVLALRSNLTEQERLAKDKLIYNNLLNLPEFNEAQSIMLFMSFGDEVDTTGIAQALLDMNKVLILPRCEPGRKLGLYLTKDLEKDLEPGMWGIREPKRLGSNEVGAEDVELVLVPGVAFDFHGNRLGYGGGYYDRFLKQCKPNVARIALGYEVQIVQWIPVSIFDEQVDTLVTEKGVYRF